MKGFSIYGSLVLILAGATTAKAQTPPPNDNFTNAILLTGNQVGFSGTLASATLETFEPYVYYGFTRSVWWKWVPSALGPVVLQVTPNNPSGGRIDAKLEVFRGTDLFHLEFLNETTLDVPAGRFLMQSLYVPTNAYYYFRVSGNWQGSFDAQLAASAQPTILQHPESCTCGGAAALILGSTRGEVVPAQRNKKRRSIPGPCLNREGVAGREVAKSVSDACRIDAAIL